ncbi:FtsK/SpoIIIE domain-containing protein [Demequina sp.]|uniref:FtsK/SpoIIIE domain-containing protein n=1 Tax=Demequina sp. TaxID=2050685 RepID=UPI003A851EB8
MRVTIPGDIDLEVHPGTSASVIAAAAGLPSLWCEAMRLDDDHPAGTWPLVHGAKLSARREPLLLADPAWTGPVVRVIDGPDAGATVAVGPAGVTVGRSSGCDLTIEDPALSREHALVTVAPRPRIVDLGSANGMSASPRRRLPATRRVRGLEPGLPVALGRTRLTLEHIATDDGNAPTPEAPMTVPWGSLVAGLAIGVGIAAMTGRWYLALLGLTAPAAATVTALARRKRRTPEPMPQWAPGPGPIAVSGDDEWARGYVRAVCLARGRGALDDHWREPWMRWLSPPLAGDTIVRLAAGQRAPTWCSTAVRVGPKERVEVREGITTSEGPWRVSISTADALARRMAAHAHVTTVPAHVDWAQVEGAASHAPRLASGRRSLTVTVGQGPDGPVCIDLDRDGPHLLVAGTTGAGKSVALELLVSALALLHGPADLSIALIDFKGGAGLRTCFDLPHVSGVLTDLDAGLSARVTSALAHELASRKAALAKQDLSSLSQWEERGGAPPRLLVVVDEYQEIASRHAAFLPEMARLAAQGRSLGLHLVLATQRPAGAVTPEVRANVTTTIALRVASGSESRDVIGSADAAQISPTTPGRALLSRAGGLEEVQLAAPVAVPGPPVRLADAPPVSDPSAGLAQAARTRWARAPRAQPLWLPPLPTHLRAPAEGAIVLAVADLPRTRERRTVTWDPGAGAAVVVGPARSGRSGALRAIGAQAARRGLVPVVLPADAREAARTLYLAASRPEVLVLVDDAESALALLSAVDDGAASDALMARLALRLPTAIACSPHAPPRLGSGATAVAIMAGVDSQSGALWGAPRHGQATASVPGRAWLRVDGEWEESQVVWEDEWTAPPLVTPLPAGVASGAWAQGGDDAGPLAAPTGTVAVLGVPGEPTSRIVASLVGAQVTVYEAAHVIPPGTTTVIVSDPTPRAVRAIAPHHWQGVTDPTPRPGRSVLVTDGIAQAVQLAMPQRP